MTDTTPTPDSVFKSNSINESTLRQLIDRVNRELLNPVWVDVHSGYLVEYRGIPGLNDEIFHALSRHYTKYGWVIGLLPSSLIFKPL